MQKSIHHDRLKDIVEKELSCSAHSMDHVLRVHELCMKLAEEECDVDLDVLDAAALLHDIARVKEDQDISGNIDHAVLGSAMAEKILRVVMFPSEKIEHVKQCIITHRFRTGNEPKTIEAKILFDSDKLDILGAIGIARSFMIAGQSNEKIYSEVPLDEYIKENLVGGKHNGRIKDGSKHSPNLEFETKLIHIPKKLYTQKAKKVASERLEYMKIFFDRLKDEVWGKL